MRFEDDVIGDVIRDMIGGVIGDIVNVTSSRASNNKLGPAQFVPFRVRIPLQAIFRRKGLYLTF